MYVCVKVLFYKMEIFGGYLYGALCGMDRISPSKDFHTKMKHGDDTPSYIIQLSEYYVVHFLLF